ncbi:MAG TPA: cytochrome c peroxidase [Polyangiaceae bacterium]|nr:cytochrome c peroxidase [Polyangiaceae bacterium]
MRLSHAVCSLLPLLASVLATGCKKPEKQAAETQTVQSVPVPEATAAAVKGPSADELTLPTLPPVPIPADNPMTEAKVKLGHQLFFDKRLSVDGSRACYSCHLNEDGTGGHDPTAIGPKNKALPRHSPVLWNVAYLPKLYWDGRSDSLEAQGTAAWAGGNMGVGKENLEAKAKEIGKIAGYKKQFKEVFGSPDPTPANIVAALSAYERTIICDNTAYDKYAKGDKSALNDSQKRGLELFMGKAACATCHTPPHFSIAALGKDGAFFNTGMGTQDKKEEEIDKGRMAVTQKDSDFAAFKPPMLRNVTKTAPYFHNGSQPVLKEAVRFMASGGYKNKNLTPLLADRKLSDAELDSIVSFLGALECPGKLEEPKLP